IDTLNSIKPVLSGLQNRLPALKQAIQEGNVEKVSEILEEVQTAAENVNNLISGIDVNQVSSTVDSLLNQVISTIETAQGSLSKADKIDFDSLLNSTKATVTNAVAILEMYQKEMPAI
ncbi:YhgE/Pip domain-containing protein, partial [Staphylococcus warneri]